MRALRRHHIARIKARVRRLFPGWEKTPRDIGVLAHTRVLCSGLCCGNRRKYEGLTIQELKYREGREQWDSI